MKTEEKKSGFSRRDLITKGAVAGAIVWAVPMIETVPAYAAVGSIAAMSCSYGFIIYSDTSSPTSTSNYYLAYFPQYSSTCGTGANGQLSTTVPVNTLQSGVTVTFISWTGHDLNVNNTIATVTDIYGTHDITAITCTGVGTMTSGNTVTANAGYYFLAAFAWNYNQSTVGQVGIACVAPSCSITSSSVTFGTSC